MTTDPTPAWRMSAARALPLDGPRILAIINVTPDSFYAGSRAPTAETALRAARAALAQGADALDLGAESTRPGADRVPAREQIERLLPALRAIRDDGPPLADIPVSIDTTLAEVARAALDAGADAINDVSAGAESRDAVLDLAAATGAGVVLMHRLRPPDADNYSDRYESPPEYGDVVRDVGAFLASRAAEALRRGVGRDAILLDPGLGFGKSVPQNLELVRRTAELARLGHPLLGAASRKSFVGRVSHPHAESTDPAERLPGSLAFSLEQLRGGVRVFRVHDVAPHRQALDAAWAIGTGRPRSV